MKTRIISKKELFKEIQKELKQIRLFYTVKEIKNASSICENYDTVEISLDNESKYTATFLLHEEIEVYAIVKNDEVIAYKFSLSNAKHYLKKYAYALEKQSNNNAKFGTISEEYKIYDTNGFINNKKCWDLEEC